MLAESLPFLSFHGNRIKGNMGIRVADNSAELKPRPIEFELLGFRGLELEASVFP